MHNYNENTLLPGKHLERAIYNNFSTLSDYVTFDHCNIWVPASALVVEQGSAALAAHSGTTGAPVLNFTKGCDVSVGFGFRKPSMWLNGWYSMRIWYTGDANAGTSIEVEPTLNKCNENTSLLAAFFSASSRKLIPAPTVSNRVLIYRGFENDLASGGRVTVSEADCFIYGGFARWGATGIGETYNKDFKVLGVELFYIEPSSMTIGSNRDKNFRHVSKP